MNEQMKIYAPVLIGAGLLASVYWFGNTDRVPSGFRGLSRRRKSRKSRR